MKDHLLDIRELNALIGLSSPNGNNYKEREHKQQQMLDYYIVVKSIVKKLSTKRTLYLYDCGCGRSYLSFYLNYYLQHDGFNNVVFVGIDHNKDLIERCRMAASAIKMNNMEFYNSNIIDFNFPYPPDIVYSLHACDTATDQMIYKGIINNTKYILSVSCCQHTMRKQMKKHPLSMVTRHKPYKERLADMISDSLRTLILEAHGYKVSVYEFVAATHTPKNIMLRCEKVQKTNEKSDLVMYEYKKLAELFSMYPVLSGYLS
ncbi:MAG: SAM-dependent methyltransferase [Firmicutes bacterium]|nr:SAM-dependent methyltransferase [Bacillota bacterium]